MPNGNDTGVDIPTDGGEVALPEPVSPQEPGSDTLIDPTPPAVVEDSPPEVDPNEVPRLQQSLKELQSIRQGQDRANTQLQKQREKLTGQIEELQGRLTAYETATTGNEGAISELQAEIDRQRQELQEHQERIAGVLQENERFKIVMGEFMGDNPIARLVQADALPQAQDADEFRMKMVAIAGSISSAAEQGHIVRIHGARPVASPPASGHMPSLGDLNGQMQVAMAAGDWDKFNSLKDQRYEMLNQTGLPSEKEGTPRF